MYSLDINFLNDRSQRATEVSAAPKVVQDDPRPLYFGVAFGAFCLAAVVAGWFLLQQRNAALAEQQAELDSQLAAANAQKSQIDTINQQVAQIEGQNKALATVFDQIKPWSAIMQDLRNRVPAGVQIDSIQQQETTETAPAAPAPAPAPAAPAPAPAPAASPDPAVPGTPVAAEPLPSTIQIAGHARSFNDVNDFLLTLQRSPFLNSENTRLVSAQLVDNPAQIKFSGDQQNSQIEVELPKVVQYSIESRLTPLPASQLLQDLERTLSVGLATRIQALRDRGVLQQ